MGPGQAVGDAAVRAASIGESGGQKLSHFQIQHSREHGTTRHEDDLAEPNFQSRQYPHCPQSQESSRAAWQGDGQHWRRPHKSEKIKTSRDCQVGDLLDRLCQRPQQMDASKQFDQPAPARYKQTADHSEQIHCSFTGYTPLSAKSSASSVVVSSRQ